MRGPFPSLHHDEKVDSVDALSSKRKANWIISRNLSVNSPEIDHFYQSDVFKRLNMIDKRPTPPFFLSLRSEHLGCGEYQLPSFSLAWLLFLHASAIAEASSRLRAYKPSIERCLIDIRSLSRARPKIFISLLHWHSEAEVSCYQLSTVSCHTMCLA